MANENKMITQAQQGDLHAFEGLYTLYKTRLTRLVYIYTGTTQDSEDILQEIFIRIFRSIEKFRVKIQFFNSTNKPVLSKEKVFRVTKNYLTLSIPFEKVSETAQTVEVSAIDLITEREAKQFEPVLPDEVNTPVITKGI